MAPELFAEWLHYIRMEEISRQVTALLLPLQPDNNKIKNLSNSLLTTADEKNYVKLLQGLVHKVFKEEWIKTMLARGADQEAVMAKIDEHWDKLEQSFEQRHPEGDRYSRSDRDHRGGKHFEGDRGRNSKGAKGGKGGKGGKHYSGDRNDNRDRRDDKKGKNKNKDKDKNKDKKRH
jgi:hypothetical protein